MLSKAAIGIIGTLLGAALGFIGSYFNSRIAFERQRRFEAASKFREVFVEEVIACSAKGEFSIRKRHKTRLLGIKNL